MVNLNQQQDSSNTLNAFARDVAAGLAKTKKTLPSRYFYDKEGSRLFQEIMGLPEYYLTRSEFEVLDIHKQQIAASFAQNSFFHLIDLGAGDASKTKIILKELLHQDGLLNYIPVDISVDAMEQLSGSLKAELPELEVEAVVGEYFDALKWLQQNKTERKVVLFLGSNIGNFEPEEGKNFLNTIRRYLVPGDQLLLGIDLKKDPEKIIPAYNDASKVTAAFNLNLLERINKELGGTFDVHKFRHYALYEPQKGAMKSYLLSLTDQDVYIKELGKSYRFEAWEAIHTENSYKYSVQQISELAKECGFLKQKIFIDENSYFADVLFIVD